MPVLPVSESIDHHVHGGTFSSYVSPSRGGQELCAWRLTLPPGVAGLPHRPSREEVLLVLDGDLLVTLDGEQTRAGIGDVVLVPAGSEFGIDSGEQGASVWVTTTPGLEATLPDGSRFRPPWAS